MWSLVTYSNYLEAVSTVMNQTHFQVAMFAFNTVIITILYVYGNICSTWFLDIRISTCCMRYHHFCKGSGIQMTCKGSPKVEDNTQSVHFNDI